MAQASAVKTASRQGGAFSVKDMTFTAMMAVVIALCSWISLPIGDVPFTLQTFAVFCALTLLGGKRGFFAVLVYILLGAVGVPVFAGFTGGYGVLIGTTGGYIIGFLIIAGLYRAAEALLKDKFNIITAVIVMLVGTALCYAFGTVWFMYVYSKKAEIDLATALSWCVTPFIIPDIAKLAAALVIGTRVKKLVKL